MSWPRPQVARTLLGKLLDSFISKLSSIAKRIPKLLKANNIAASKKNERKGSTKGLPLSPLPDLPEEPPVAQEMPSVPVLYQQTVADEEKEVNDTRHLLQTLMMGIKTLLFSISHYNRAQQVQVVAGASSTRQCRGLRWPPAFWHVVIRTLRLQASCCRPP